MATAGKHRGFITSIFWSVCPNYCTFASAHSHLWEKGTLAVNRARMISSHAAILRGCIAAFWEQSLHQHQHSYHAVGVNRHLKWNVEGEQQFYPSHWQMVQALGHNDYLCQDQFVGWLVHYSTDKPTFLQWCSSWMRPISFEIFNNHNRHVWAEVNPHVASVHYHQQRFVVNVPVCIMHDFLIGPYL